MSNHVNYVIRPIYLEHATSLVGYRLPLNHCILVNKLDYNFIPILFVLPQPTLRQLQNLT